MNVPRRNAEVSQRVLIVAMAAVVLSFVLATAYSQRQLRELDRHATAIVERGVPSIENLAETRTLLRRVVVTLDGYVNDRAAVRAPNGARLDTLLAELRHAIDTYDDLPLARDKIEAFEPLRALLKSLLDNIQSTRDAADAGLVVDARRRVDQRIEVDAAALDEALYKLLQVHVASARDHARQVRDMRQRERFTAWLLDGISLALAVLAAALAIRTVRHQTRALEERSHELELFASRLAHDVLGPLTAAAVALELARRRARISGDEKLAEQVERGRASLERSKRIADGLLDFARAGARPEPGAHADLREVIEGVVDEVRAEAERTSTTIALEPLPSAAVAASPGALLSIVGNLVRNALKHMGERPVRRITVRAVEHGSDLRVEVEDTGPGVPRELAANIFEPYMRAPNASQQPGLGLGLATVKRIGEAYGGSVGVRPAVPGPGSVFWVELPRAR